MKPLTQEQGLTLTGFTGVVCVNSFGDFHADVEKRMGRPVFTHEFPELSEQIKELYREDFKALMEGVPS